MLNKIHSFIIHTMRIISILKSLIRINSSHVVCAIESSSSNASIQSELALSGRYTV